MTASPTPAAPAPSQSGRPHYEIGPLAPFSLAPAHPRAPVADTSDAPAVVHAPFPRWGRGVPARTIRLALQQTVVFPLHAAVCRPFRVYGRHHLEELDSPALIVANHASHLDTPAVLRALPPALRRRVAVAAAADYFYAEPTRGVLTTVAFNAFPFARRGSSLGSLAYCRELVAAGWSILFFPEGTRSPTGAPLPFKPGAGLLARELGVPVVPVAIEGTAGVLPKGRRCPRPGPVSVRFGPPVHVLATADARSATALLRGSLDLLRAASAAA